MPEEAQTKKKRERSKWIQYFQNRQLGHRLIIAFTVTLALTLFLHFREVRIQLMELHSIAKNFIVAHVDFEFPDEESTEILKQESVRDIGKIFQISPSQIKRKRLAFENDLIHHQNWRKTLPHTTFEELYKGADQVQEILSSLRFTDQRTIRKMEQAELSLDSYYEIDTTDKSLELSERVWEDIQQELKETKEFHTETIAFILDFFRKIHWTIEIDSSLQRSIRKVVAASVPVQYTRVHAGTRIIEQGEKVSSRQVAMLRAMKEELRRSRNLWQPLTLLSSFFFAVLLVAVGGFYFAIHHRVLLRSVKKLWLFALILILTLALAKLVEYVLLKNPNNLFDIVKYPLLIPFIAIIFAVLLGEEIALFTSCILTIVLGVTLAVDHSRFLVINLLTSIVAILCARHMRKRKEVFVVCGKVWLTTIPIFFLFYFEQNELWNYAIFSDMLSSFAFMLLTAILVVGILPILESVFDVMTDITLMEYMDPNNELLKRLSLEAPGTYQHSLVVGTLAEAAAQAIGANGLFCRVSTLYHDIGKLFNPHYFTENQMGGFNIHQLLTPLESAQVIIAHVTEGEALAKKHGLPPSFLKIIREHHGTTLVYYFYAKEVEQKKGEVDQVDEGQFRYPGPKPKTKESAIIMIADSVEAASRSMENVNEESITELVERLIEDKADEGQFDECELTFQELGVVKKTIIKTLSVTRHIRIKYPEKKQVEMLS